MHQGDEFQAEFAAGNVNVPESDTSVDVAALFQEARDIIGDMIAQEKSRNPEPSPEASDDAILNFLGHANWESEYSFDWDCLREHRGVIGGAIGGAIGVAIGGARGRRRRAR